MANRKISNQFRELLKQELQIWQTDGSSLPSSPPRCRRDTVLTRYKKRPRDYCSCNLHHRGRSGRRGRNKFVAANWESIPAAAKVAIIVAFMLACHFIGYYLWRISAISPRLGHSLVVLGTLVFGRQYRLMAQIFHIHRISTTAFSPGPSVRS